jgi:hypothetical protein
MLLLENISHDELKDYMKEFYNYALEHLKIDRPPKIVFKKNKKNADDMFGKTGYYDPETETLALFITDRHAKDILRSFAHELIHHEQKCRGDDKKINLSLTAHDPAYASHDEGLREMEREAFERGNMMFRDWCDGKKLDREENMMNEKMSKEKIKKGHKIGKVVKKSGSADEPFAVGMAAAKKLEEKGGAKPDFLDIDGDGNKKEPMKKAVKDAKKAGKQAAKDHHAAHRGEDMKKVKEQEGKEKLSEDFQHPYPDLFTKKERMFQERFNEYEQWKYEELLKKALKK